MTFQEAFDKTVLSQRRNELGRGRSDSMRRHRLDVVRRERRTVRILNIPVKAIDQIDDTRKVHVRMLNYLTAPHVVVWSASRFL